MVVEEKRDTVVVNDDRNPSYGWLIAVAVIVVLIILFFLFGGMNLFNGAGGSTNINVQPTTPSAPSGQ